ncbi:MAG: tol-pal system protein YbgF [Deltaproteobacteria bacterium]|nr:tol-pal system protein YbgF [Deltaproteobacteria bacterium]
MHRRNLRHLASVLCLALLGAAAGGCAVADTGAFVRLQEDMEVLKAEAAASRRMAPSPAATDSDELASFRRNLADLAADNDRIKADLLAVITRTDETKLEMQKEVSRLNGTTVEMGQAIQEVRGKVARLEEKVGVGTSPPPAAAPPKATLGEPSAPEEMYDYALGLIKNGNTKKGREVLNTFAAKYPDHRLMQNVFYWKGETFYAEKDYESAILSFQDVVDKFAGGEKAPDAMLKQGLSFQALNDNRNARILYELLLSKYPKSPAAERARQRLAELK